MKTRWVTTAHRFGSALRLYLTVNKWNWNDWRSKLQFFKFHWYSKLYRTSCSAACGRCTSFYIKSRNVLLCLQQYKWCHHNKNFVFANFQSSWPHRWGKIKKLSKVHCDCVSGELCKLFSGKYTGSSASICLKISELFGEKCSFAASLLSIEWFPLTFQCQWEWNVKSVSNFYNVQ